jgi:hypothetical protein
LALPLSSLGLSALRSNLRHAKQKTFALGAGSFNHRTTSRITCGLSGETTKACKSGDA